MHQLIYVETSIPSFYFETRLTVPENQARRNWTRRWWDKAQSEDTLVTSLAVINELSAAPEPKRGDALSLIDKLTLLQDDPEVDDLVDAYITNKVMPSDATGDMAQVRYTRLVELPSHRQRQQGRSHPPDQRQARF